MLDVLGHIAALEVVRARIETAAAGDPQLADASAALTDHYPFALLGAIVDHLLAHDGPSDAEVALLEEATALYAALRSFTTNFRALRDRMQQVAIAPSAPGALDRFNAVRAELAGLFDRHEQLHADFNAYSQKLQPPSHLVVHPRALDVPARAWPWRDLVLSRRTGVFAAHVARLAREDGRPEALALAAGVLAGHAGNLVGSPYLAHAVSGPRRSHPYRDRVAAYAVGAWTRAAAPAIPLSFPRELGVPVLGSPDDPALPDWTAAMLTEALRATYGGDVDAASPDLQAAYAQLLRHWQLMQAFLSFPVPAAMPLVLDERIANTLTPGEVHTTGGPPPTGPPPGTEPPTGPPPTTSGGSAPTILDSQPGAPPWFRPTHDNVIDYITEACLDILFLPYFLIRVGAWLWEQGDSHEPPNPSTPVAPAGSIGGAKAKLTTAVDDGDLAAATDYGGPGQGKPALIAVATLEEMDRVLHRVGASCLRIMKLSGLLYPDAGELAQHEYRQFLVLPDAEFGFVWPARPPASVKTYIQPPETPLEEPAESPSTFNSGEKPVAFLRRGTAGAPSMAEEGVALVIDELLDRSGSAVRTTDPDLDADRGEGHPCWTPRDGTSIADHPVDVVLLAYGEL